VLNNLWRFFPKDLEEAIKRIRNEAVGVKKQLEKDLKQLDKTFKIRRRFDGLLNMDAGKDVEALCQEFGTFLKGIDVENLPSDPDTGLQLIANLELRTREFVRNLADAVTYRLGEDLYEPARIWLRYLLNQALFNRLSEALPVDPEKVEALNREANSLFSEAETIVASRVEVGLVRRLSQTFRETLIAIMDQPIETWQQVRIQLMQVDVELKTFLKQLTATIGYSLQSRYWKGSLIAGGLPLHAPDELPEVRACQVYARLIKRAILSNYAERCCEPLEEILNQVESEFRESETLKTAPSQIKATVNQHLKPISKALGHEADTADWQYNFMKDLLPYLVFDTAERVRALLERSIELRKFHGDQSIDTQTSPHLEYSMGARPKNLGAITQLSSLTHHSNSFSRHIEPVRNSRRRC
jgi:hypothetical protein